MPGKKTPKAVLNQIIRDFKKVKRELRTLKKKARGTKKIKLEAKIQKVDCVLHEAVALCRGGTKRAFN
jgi:hypothetical protein